jgi:predicted SAM-dependent methyltransferase
MNPILSDLTILQCVNCKSNDWNLKPNLLNCKSCASSYVIDENEKIIAVHSFIEEENWELVSDGFDLLKGNEKPIKKDKLGGPRITSLRKKLGIKGLAVNLGSGKDDYPNFINMDLGRYKPVHLVTNFAPIPFVDNSVELIACNSVLEHIYDYQTVVNEATRILQPGGYFYLAVPFMSIRHHKFDYHRWTSVGLNDLMKRDFEIIESGACRGVAYSIISFVEALLTYKVKNRFMLWVSRRIWRLVSRPLLWIKDEETEEYQALSNTIYVLGKKK